MIPIKLSFNGEVRRVTLYSEEKLDYSTLRSKTNELFPSLSDKVVTFLWSDDENDIICCSTDDEIEEAVRVMKSENKSTFRFDVISKALESANLASPSASAANEGISRSVHAGVRCDECRIQPIVGSRYKCVVRDNFDLCENCERSKPQPFPMLKLYEPNQDEYINFFCFGESNVRRCRCGKSGCPGFCPRQAYQSAVSQAKEAKEVYGKKIWEAGCCLKEEAGRKSEQAKVSAKAAKVHCEKQMMKCSHHAKKAIVDSITAVNGKVTPLAQLIEEFIHGVVNSTGGNIQSISYNNNNNNNSSSNNSNNNNEKAHIVSNVAGGASVEVEVNFEQELMEQEMIENALRNSLEDHDHVQYPLSSLDIPVSTNAVVDNSSPIIAFKPSYAMKFIRDVTIMDGSIVQAGSSCTKIWLVRNDSNVAWSNVSLVKCGGDPLVNEGSQFPVMDAAPGQEVELSIFFEAPSVAGRYVAYFRLMNNDTQQLFGQRLWADLRIETDESDDWTMIPSSIPSEVSATEAVITESEPSPVASVVVSVESAAAVAVEEVVVKEKEEHEEVSEVVCVASDDMEKALGFVNSFQPSYPVVPDIQSSPPVTPVVLNIPPQVPQAAVAPIDSVDVPIVPTMMMSPPVAIQPQGFVEWSQEIATLRDMGFTDMLQLIPLLQAHVPLGADEVTRMAGLERIILALLN